MSFNFLDRKWGQDDLGTAGGNITWSMTLSGLNYDSRRYPFLTETQFENAIRDAFDAWEAVANISFTEILNPDGFLSNGAVDIDLGFASLGNGTVGVANSFFRPGTDDGDGINTITDVSIDFDTGTTWLPNGGAGGISLYAVAVHEIGHALGLGHVDDPSEILNPFVSASDLGEGDIAGIQTIYGAKISGNLGNNTLVGSAGEDLLFGGNGNDQLKGGSRADALFGGSGIDRVLYDTANAGVVADLILSERNTGDARGDTYDSIELVYGSAYADELRGTQTNNLLAGNNGDDKLYGRGGNDDIFGGNGNDWLDGGAGADELFGGAGVDRVLYNTARTGLTVDLILSDRNTGDAAGDTYSSIELAFGSAFADEIRGTQTNNVLVGNAGNDLLYGRNGNDDIFAGAGDDFIDGGAGDDDLFGGFGADVFYGGAGTDRVIYSTATSGVVADLILSDRNTGEAFGDTYSSIETVFGSTYNDELRGTQTNNVIVGNAGRDALYGRGGSDDIFGGAGSDFLDSGAGNDDLYGGTGTDDFKFRPGSGSDIVHDFAHNTDTLVFDDALWTGARNVQQVISDFGTLSSGNAVFDFNNGSVVTVLGVTNLFTLADDIDIV